MENGFREMMKDHFDGETFADDWSVAKSTKNSMREAVRSLGEEMREIDNLIVDKWCPFKIGDQVIAERTGVDSFGLQTVKKKPGIVSGLSVYDGANNKAIFVVKVRWIGDDEYESTFSIRADLVNDDHVPVKRL